VGGIVMVLRRAEGGIILHGSAKGCLERNDSKILQNYGSFFLVLFFLLLSLGSQLLPIKAFLF
jgi:hypothetical protein